MKGMTQYGAVATKIRGMRSHLLTTEDYNRLANCQNVRDVVAFLKSHPCYSEPLEGLDTNNMRRETFERLLLHSIFLDFGKISHFLDRKQKKFLDVYAVRYDLRLLNDIIREIFNKHSEPVDLGVYRRMYLESKNMNFEKIYKAQSIEELLAGIEGTIYYEPIYRVKTELNDPVLFDYETALSRFYFSYFWQQLELFNSKFDKETLLEVHGVEIDLLNMIWVYRSKTYYDLDAKEIYRFLIPASHKLKPRQLAMMIGSQTKEELMQHAGETYYRKYIDPRDASSLERAYTEQISKINDKNRKSYPYSFAVIEAYLYDKQTEVDRLVRIAESVRYGYDPKLIINALNIRGNR